MANIFATDILTQASDPKEAAAFYVEYLGCTVTSEKPMIELNGPHIMSLLAKRSAQEVRARAGFHPDHARRGGSM